MKTYGKVAVEYRKTDSLIPYVRNPRRNDDAAQKLAGVIAEFGFTVPVIIRSNGEIIDGHARLKAAQILKLDEVPVIVNDEWTETQAKAFRLAVNKSAEWAEWDDELLKLELEELKLEDVDLELVGFDTPAPKNESTIEKHGSLAEKFGFAPFSVLDARSGQWQNRKQAWLSLGIDSELGWGGGLLRFSPRCLGSKGI